MVHPVTMFHENRFRSVFISTVLLTVRQTNPIFLGRGLNCFNVRILKMFITHLDGFNMQDNFYDNKIVCC